MLAMTSVFETSWSRPLWSYTATAAAAPTPFVPDQSWDVAVVGSGITGCSAALHLALAGARVVALDREPPGSATSGSANGQVLPGLHSSPGQILAAYGPEFGERILDFIGGAPDIVFGLIEQHAIDCHPVRAGWLETTRKEKDLAGLEKSVRAWARRGAPAEMVGRAEAERLIGTRVYAGGALDRRAGTVQPLSYVRGLASAAQKAGAAICSGVEVRVLRRENAGWRVRTSAGDVVAKSVIVATNAFSDGLIPRLRRSMIYAHGVQIATAPLPPALRASVLPQGHACSDIHTVVERYFRMDHDGRLVIGGPAWFTPPWSGRATSFRLVERSIREMFPQLAAVALETRWYARGAASVDLTPHLHEPAPGVFAGVGFAGRGIAMGTAFGALMARRAQGETAKSLPFPTTGLGVLPFSIGPATRHWLKVLRGKRR